MMKPDILQLEAIESLNSIQQKIINCQSRRILIVWQDRSSFYFSELDALLLLRFIERLNIQIAVVASDKEIRRKFNKYGITVFNKVADALKKPWRKPKLDYGELKSKNISLEKNIRQWADELKEENKSNKIPLTKRWISFLSAILAVLILLGSFIPSAEIKTLSPSVLQKVELRMSSDPSIKEITINGAVPSQKKEMEVNIELIGKSSGKTLIQGEKARGIVTFRNLTEDEVVIPPSTVVVTDNGIRFETVQEGTLPPEKNSSIELQVEITLVGPEGNLSKSKISFIEGELNEIISASITQPFSGGIDRSVAVATEEDYQQLELILDEEIRRKALEIIGEEASPNMFIFSNSITILRKIEIEKTPPVGTISEKISLNSTAIVSYVMINKNDLEQAVLLAMNSNLQPGYLPDNSSYKLSMKEDSMSFKNDRLSWNVVGERLIYKDFSDEHIPDKITLMPVEKAEFTIKEIFDLDADPQIDVYPKFWKWMPFYSFKINWGKNENS